MTDDINGPWKIGDRLWPPGAPKPYVIKGDDGESWVMEIPNGGGDTITDNLPKSLEYLEGPGKWTKIDPNPAPQTKLRGTRTRSRPPNARKTIAKKEAGQKRSKKRSKRKRSKKRSKTKRSKTKRSKVKR